MDRVIHLIKQDKLRLKALDCVYHLDLPQCYIAAGFVRNVVWDHLHKFTNSSQLNDVDVIYFNPTEKNLKCLSIMNFSFINACHN